MKARAVLVTLLCLVAPVLAGDTSFDQIVLRADNISLSNVVVGAVATLKQSELPVWGELETIEVNYLTTGATCNVRIDATNTQYSVATTLLFITNTLSGTGMIYRPRFPITATTGEPILSATNQNEKYIFYGDTINFWAANAPITNKSVKVKIIVRK